MKYQPSSELPMPYRNHYRHDRHHGYHRHRPYWRKRPRDNAGKWLIGLLILMALVGLGGQQWGVRSPTAGLPSGSVPPLPLAYPTPPEQEAPTPLMVRQEPVLQPGDEPALTEPMDESEALQVAAPCEGGCAEAFQHYLQAAGPKAFVISNAQSWHWQVGASSQANVVRDVMAVCMEQVNNECRLAHSSE